MHNYLNKKLVKLKGGKKELVQSVNCFEYSCSYTSLCIINTRLSIFISIIVIHLIDKNLTVTFVVVVAISLCARILEECLTTHSPPVLFFLFFLGGD